MNSRVRTLRDIMSDVYLLTDELREALSPIEKEVTRAGMKNLLEMSPGETIRLAQLVIATERIKP